MKSPRLNRRAFTLIELMVVVAIMAVALTLSYPAIRETINRAPLTQGVRDVMKACRIARQRAILSGKPAEMRIYGDGRIEVGTAPMDLDTSVAPTDAVPLKPVLITDVEAKPKSDPGSFTAQLSDSVGIEAIGVNFMDFQGSDLARVRFFPNGTCDEFTMVLLANGERRKISLEVVTALADVQAL